ncbi:30S ribosomal protein S5 alanine N-acetyltransferase [Trinickia violacea]|uniref:[Ribosomal protein uS5]-alanine N-acetyltransferase n=1 Tax=Trinickia violacea TaxID=2571746 RepID=A0A4P8IX47_9BURK|nr:ribosomal protein S5-alanine N-acetyltransferase [Trinickia violacea]QCP53862.1 30S ribosomal protein S5 alanine N-acetyltransferase [Trinickia violacea]
MPPALPFPPEGIVTARVVLRTASPADSETLLAYYAANSAHLKPWEPARPPHFYERQSIEARLALMTEQMAAGNALHVLLFERSEGELIGDCNFTNIVRGPFQACHLGYALGARFEGRGLMHEALSAAIAFMFETVGLHRVMANYRPENQRSARLLEKLGFEREGLARAYLKIDGAWADHVLTSLINPADR